MAQVLVLHGPNLNLLGVREPEVYGRTTLAEINASLVALGTNLGLEVATFQSNAEHLLIERIHEAFHDGTEFAVFNPAGFTHTSVALRDALSGVGLPFIEVHLSNIHQREQFRHHSYFSAIATAVICGLGPGGYEMALRGAADWLAARR